MAKNKRNAKKKSLFYTVGQGLLMLFYMPVYRIKVEGTENIPTSGPVLLCSNHVAAKDPVVLGLAQKRQVFYMAKEELFRNPFIGAVLRGLGAFPVKRGTGGADALEEGYKLLDDNAVVGVFIEGHRSATGELQKPKTGAALLAYRTKAPVVPVCITAEDGKRPRAFHKMLISFGKPLTAEQLAIPDESSMQLRRASRTIMGEITNLRVNALKEFGVALPPPAQPEAKGEG